jgi:hypothetical protein
VAFKDDELHAVSKGMNFDLFYERLECLSLNGQGEGHENRQEKNREKTNL